MRLSHPTLAGAAAALLAAASAWDLASVARRPPPAIAVATVGATDVVTRTDDGWASVAQQIAARRIAGVVGYWGPVPADELHGEGPEVQRFYLAQFALVPVILQADGLREWLVTDLLPEESRPLPPGYVTVREFSDGRRLMRRTRP